MTNRLGIVNPETWIFFNEIYDSIKDKYSTTIFTPRIWKLPIFYSRVNQYLFRQDLTNFLKTNDIVFFEWASNYLVQASHLPKYCKTVTRLHRYEMYTWANKINWDNVDKIILVSQAKKEEFLKLYPDQGSKISVSSPSTSLEKFKYFDKEFSGNIGILCNLSPRKRVYELILAFYEIIQTQKEMELHIGGGIDEGNEDYFVALTHMVNELNLASRVKFYGHVTDTWNWLRNIDIFISNGYSEGLQVAPMEAMATGCYCLSHRWNGANELVSEENLYFTNAELQELILRYCDLSESEKKKQRKRMRHLAEERFDIKKTILDICTVIDGLLIESDDEPQLNA